MTFALITPSYAPDHERCRLLVESVERLVPDDIRHYVIVDSRDMRLFRGLASARVSLLAAEDILPEWIRRDPSEPTSWGWTSRHGTHISNWVLQQLIKLSAFDVIEENMAIFCDSDNVFIRPFDPRERLLGDDGRLLLHCRRYQNEDLRKWHVTAAQLLGLADCELPVRNYVGNLIAWRRENVMALRARIASVCDSDWLEAVSRHGSLSEYVLYGVFVNHCLGLAEAGHAVLEEPLIKPSWDVDLTASGAMDEFFRGLGEQHVGIMVHSKDDVPVESYAARVRSLWN